MAGEGGSAGFNTSFTDITGALGDIFGGSQTQGGSGTSTSSATQTERVQLDEAALQKIIEDVLGGADGLASIFAGEQNAGIFNSSVAAQASGDLAARLVGELAKLTGEKVTTQEAEQQTASTQKAESGGLLDSIGGFFGF